LYLQSNLFTSQTPFIVSIRLAPTSSKGFHPLDKGATMKFSLIDITDQSGSFISGYWLQDHVGTLASVIKAARATEATNSNKITVAVVTALSSTCAILSYWNNLTRLDIDS